MLTSSRDAKKVKCQHKRPCHDCPWRRKSLPRWLGGATPQQWLAEAHSDNPVHCHALRLAAGGPVQCVGIANYRANVAKSPRDPRVLRGKRDNTVFGQPAEFLQHHENRRKGPAA